MNAVRSVVICADDIGLDARIDAASVELVELGRLSAVSVLAEGPSWPAAARALRAARRPVEVGLHLNLTEDFGDGALGIGAALHGSLFGTLDQRDVQRRFERQVDRFTSELGRAPDFLDGHQHVHMLPGVRAITLALCADARPWLRMTDVAGAPPSAWLKSLVLRGFSAGFRAAAKRAGRVCSARLLGVYDLAPGAPFASLLRDWLRMAGPGDVLMCHPATDAVPGDALGATRPHEFAVLRSAEFGAWLEAESLRPGSLAASLKPGG